MLDFVSYLYDYFDYLLFLYKLVDDFIIVVGIEVIIQIKRLLHSYNQRPIRMYNRSRRKKENNLHEPTM
jgi:hypothetical protein